MMMMIMQSVSIMLLLSTFPMVHGESSSSSDDIGCSVCGDGKTITKPEVVFSYPGQPSLTCKQLEDAGETGIIPLTECGILPQLIDDTCGCRKKVHNGSCSVCGQGMKVTKFDEMFSFPGQPTIACGQLEYAGNEGVIPLTECGILPSLIKKTCGCQREDNGSSSTPAPIDEQTNESCSVCGDGKIITKPEEVFSFPGQPSVTCKQLEDAGETGIIPLTECGILPQLVDDTCGCRKKIHDDSCSVCGQGLKVTKFDEIFSFPGQPTVSCGQLEYAGYEGVIPLTECGILPSLIKKTCGCQREDSGSSPTPAPIRSPSSAEQSNNGCSVCGRGKAITKPDTVFAYPGQPAITCKQLEDAGETGIIPLTECGILPQLIDDTCGCRKVRNDNSCSVCGPGKKVTRGDELFSYPGEPIVSCKHLEDAGNNGIITDTECKILPALIKNACGCENENSPIPISPPREFPTLPFIPPTTQSSLSQSLMESLNNSSENDDDDGGMPTEAILSIIAGLFISLILLLAYCVISKCGYSSSGKGVEKVTNPPPTPAITVTESELEYENNVVICDKDLI